jgi:hypothetical protein
MIRFLCVAIAGFAGVLAMITLGHSSNANRFVGMETAALANAQKVLPDRESRAPRPQSRNFDEATAYRTVVRV